MKNYPLTQDCCASQKSIKVTATVALVSAEYYTGMFGLHACSDILNVHAYHTTFFALELWPANAKYRYYFRDQPPVGTDISFLIKYHPHRLNPWACSPACYHCFLAAPLSVCNYMLVGARVRYGGPSPSLHQLLDVFPDGWQFLSPHHPCNKFRMSHRLQTGIHAFE